MLASRAFAERWARHWLDVARFGESVTLRGFIFPNAWRYRDFVIDALATDMPYDRFIRLQIAGDLMPASSPGEKARNQIATTYLVLGNTNFEEQVKKQLDMDVVDDMLDTIGTVNERRNEDGIVYDAQKLLADVRRMVRAAKDKEGFEIRPVGR